MRKAIVLAGSIVLLAGVAASATLAPVLLPTEWHLSPPPGAVAPTGTLPMSVTLSADGAHVIVVEDGQAGAAVRMLNPQTLATETVVKLKGAYGIPLPDRTGAGFWVSGAAQDALQHVDAASGALGRSIALPKGFWGAAIARSPDGKTLAVSGDLADAVVLIDEASGRAGAPIAVGHHPAGLVFAPGGKTLYVANWAGNELSVIDVPSARVRATIPVGKHPEALLLARGGTTLYVSEPDDDAIGVVDVAAGKRVADINVGTYDGKLFGASPSALALSRDEKRLYATTAAANAIAVLSVSASGGEVIGAIPAGWYPTAVSLDPANDTLFVADGKGEGSRANPQFDPYGPRERRSIGYIAANMIGSVRRIPVPNDADARAGLAVVRQNGGPGLPQALADAGALANGPASDEPGRAIVRAGGPIRHVIYVIKENRTYDQVLGDLPGADGDPKLALFDQRVTPNEHALARRFGIFDNAYADAQVSADGHNWSMAAFANDYLEKMWPPNYGNRRDLYDFEDGADASVPHSGYLWNDAEHAGVALRNYGEFVTNPARAGEPVTTQMPGLAAVTDAHFIGFDTSYRDEDREAEWAREFAGYVARGDLPPLEILRFPNDHTAGTRPGARTPTAMVAENDLAVGRMVDAVSHSPYWKDTLIVSVEDDAQAGPDHVDAERMPVYVVSPYAKGGTQHVHYSTAGILRTIELILGLPPMTAYDAAAQPLYAAFTTKPDERPYVALPENVDLEAKNTVASYRARDSAHLDFSHEDGVPEGVLNDIVWRAVRGAKAPLPAYGVFQH